jgi:hypothetical protein
MADIAPTATVPYIAWAVAASAGGTITDSICMQARCNMANVRPCSGSTRGDANKQEDRKRGPKTIAERNDSGHGEQHGKDLLVLAEPICEARNDRPGDQSDGSSRR